MSEGLRDSIFRSMAGALPSAINQMWDRAAKQTDSPIEAGLLVSLQLLCRIYDIDLRVVADEAAENAERPLNVIIVRPQVKVGKYRIDFRVSAKVEAGERSILVECDGHDFHEKTKEQAARDKERDRYITATGAQISRYTGSEIYRNPHKCAADVIFNLWGLPHGQRGEE